MSSGPQNKAPRLGFTKYTLGRICQNIYERGKCSVSAVLPNRRAEILRDQRRTKTSTRKRLRDASAGDISRSTPYATDAAAVERMRVKTAGRRGSSRFSLRLDPGLGFHEIWPRAIRPAVCCDFRWLRGMKNCVSASRHRAKESKVLAIAV